MSVIPANKTKLLLSHSATEAGETELLFSIETDFVRLFGYLPENSGALWWDLYEMGSGIEGFERLIYRSPTYKGPSEPEVFTTSGGQLFKIKIFYTAAATFHLVGTSAGVGEARESAPAVSQGQINSVITSLANIELALDKIVNHLRVMTEINEEEGENY